MQCSFDVGAMFWWGDLEHVRDENSRDLPPHLFSAPENPAKNTTPASNFLQLGEARLALGAHTNKVPG